MTESTELEATAARPPVADSIIARDIQSAPQLRSRVESLLRVHLWRQVDEDPRQPLPLDDIMWCVAANSTLQSTVRSAMEDPSSENPNMTAPAVDLISDVDLAYVVLEEAWPRLRPDAPTQ